MRRPSASGEAAPVTYGISAQFAADELDYADMIALAEMFDRWIFDETDISPAQRTMLVELSVDFERITDWVEPSWRAADPVDADRP